MTTYTVSHRLTGLGLLIVCLIAPASPVHAADHGDTPLLINANRQDALLTDLHAFIRNDRLVLAVCLNPAIPREVTQYTFASDLEVAISIDNDSPVSFDDPADLAAYGGTLLNPGQVKADIELKVKFSPRGEPQLQASGIPAWRMRDVQFFSGLRDDPFIRGPRRGRNVAAIVIELPLQDVMGGQGTLLLWATSRVPSMGGPFQDLAGRAIRSMFPENDQMNQLQPRQHWKVMGKVPDVMIFDTSRAAAYPNGRDLADDVVDLVGDPRVLASDAPFPDANDVPFLDVFPYLSPPHAPPPPPIQAPADETPQQRAPVAQQIQPPQDAGGSE